MGWQTTTRVYPQRRPKYFIFALCFLFAIFTGLGTMSASTGYPNEISNLNVVNITQTSVDIVWDTVHPSTSQVLLCRDANYQPEVRIPWTVTLPPPPPGPPPKPGAPTSSNASTTPAGGADLVTHHTCSRHRTSSLQLALSIWDLLLLCRLGDCK